MTCALGGFGRVKCDLDPVVAAHKLIDFCHCHFRKRAVLCRLLLTEGQSILPTSRVPLVLLIDDSPRDLLEMTYRRPL